MKKIFRITESELKGIIKESVERVLREDVLGDNWHENDDVYNNYEPFEDQERHEQENEFRDNHDWGAQGEENIDPTQYDDYDPTADDPEAYMDYDDHDPTDNELYHYGQL